MLEWTEDRAVSATVGPDVGAAQDDHSLMRRVASRDPNALAALYDRHAALVFALCLHILDRADAEDLLVDVFWELGTSPRSLDPGRGSPVSYLVLLAQPRDRSRKGGKRTAAGPLIADDLPATSMQTLPPAQTFPNSRPGQAGEALRSSSRSSDRRSNAVSTTA